MTLLRVYAALALCLGLGLPEPVIYTAKVGGKIAPDGRTEIQIDLPGHLHRENIGSPPPRFPGDPRSLGCCVFRSLDHAAHWQNVKVLQGFPEWMVKEGIPGGGWPEKVRSLVSRKCKQAGVPVPDYIQVEGMDLEILKLACATGRMPSVTYGFSPTGRYNHQKVAHMTNVVHCDDAWVAILDNNFIGENKYEWMTPAEFRRVYAPGWAVILLDCGPPPPPKN